MQGKLAELASVARSISERELLSRAFSARNAYWRPRAAYLGLAQHGRHVWLKINEKTAKRCTSQDSN